MRQGIISYYEASVERTALNMCEVQAVPIGFDSPFGYVRPPLRCEVIDDISVDSRQTDRRSAVGKGGGMRKHQNGRAWEQV